MNPRRRSTCLSTALALALFALSAGIAAMDLLQQRQLKAKQFGRLFSRLPPLEPLTRLNGRLLWAGFVAYGLAFVSGSVAASVIWPDGWSWDAQQAASMAVLAVYGALAMLLGSSGSPRRRAVATVAAFVLAVAALGAARAVPEATRHGGDDGLADLTLEEGADRGAR